MNPIIKINNKLEISNIPPDILEELKSTLILDNPLWEDNIKHGYSNFKTPRKLYYIQNKKENITIPRGFINKLVSILESHSLNFKIIDKTILLPRLNLRFTGKLKGDFQKQACSKILKRRFGILQAPTGSGKTVMALYITAKRQQPTLIIVHTKELMYQWQNKISEFLDIPKRNIGLIGDGSMEIKNITIAIINSLYKITDDVSPLFGFVITDECHRIPGRTFSEAVSRFPSKFMLGLSATPYRRDGLTNVMHFYMGETIHIIDTKELQDRGHIMKASLKVIETEFNCYVTSGADYSKVIKLLIENEERNNLIVDNVIKHIKKDKGITLVISDRKEHCSTLHYMLIKKRIKALIVTGTSSSQQRQETINKLNKGEGKVLVATGQLIGEGFDLESLSSIFLTTPIKWEGRVIQYIGRILRVCKGKDKAVIYDFFDQPWILQHSFRKRLDAYRKLGIDMNHHI